MAEQQDTPVPKIRIVLFSGGSGTGSLTEALLKQSQVSLTILINAYDDGHSTGRLRRFVPGMLGPSDVRKNVSRLMPQDDACYRALRKISDLRLPEGATYRESIELVKLIADGDLAALPEVYRAPMEQLSLRHARLLSSFLNAFLAYAKQQAVRGVEFNFTDCAIGNLIFTGCYLEQNCDFNAAVGAFTKAYDCQACLLNVTRGENLFLVAIKEDGAALWNEAEIVAAHGEAPIRSLVLTTQEALNTALERNQLAPMPEDAVYPEINPEAAQAIREADIVIYGPGTQHSSLFPSYLTRSVAEAIASNASADKVFVANIRRDFDILTEDANDIARKFLEVMSRYGQSPASWKDLVTHFLVQGGSQEHNGHTGYVPFNPEGFSFPLETVRVRDWETHDGHHSGGYFVDELQQIVQSRIGIQLQQLHHLASIVVPALNEERTVEQALKQLLSVDFAPLGLSKEIILVDGGSSDRTVEIARSVRSVRVCEVPAGSGRGAALRRGIEEARGSVILFFPADLEYDISDLAKLMPPIIEGGYEAVFGTRAALCNNLDDKLRMIYEKRTSIRLISKYGGMLIATLTLFLYSRYVSDTLTSVKIFSGRLLRSLELSSNGIDLDGEIVAKLCKRRTFILEMPVSYEPRTRKQGKKITISGGLKLVTKLISLRFAGPRA